MKFGWMDGVVLIGYFVAIMFLGLYQARKIKNTGDFFAGGRTFNKFLMMMHSLGTGTHADDPVGVVGASFKYGLAGIWYTFVYLFVTPFYWLMAPLFRRSRFLTTADFFEARFGAGLGTLYAVWGILIFAVNMGTLLIGTGKIVEAVSLGAVDPVRAILGMTVVFLIYGTAGGLHATVVTESVQGLLIVVMSLLLVPFGLMRVGGFEGLHGAVSPDLFRLTGLEELSLWWILAGFVMNLINIVAQPHTMEVCSTGKTEFEGRVGFTYGNFVKRFCALGWALTGVVVAAMIGKGLLDPIAREQAFGTAIRVLLPAGLTGLMFAAILAAQMSTLSAFMVAASALLSRNVYKKHIAPGADDAKMLKVARISGLVTVALGVLFAMKVQGVADALMWFWTLSTFTGVFMWAGVLWRRTNATGAWASFFVMLTIWVVIGEPGAALGQFLAKRNYAEATPAAIARLNSEARPFSQAIFSVTRQGDKGPEQKTVVVVRTGEQPATGGNLGFSIREGRNGTVVAEVVEHSPAAKAGLKQGDVIVRSAKMSYLGIFAEKRYLHFRALAFLPLGIIALIIGSLVGKPFPKDKLEKFYLLIKTPVGREKELIEQGVDVVYAGASKGHPWELNHRKAVNVIGFLVALVLSGAFFGLLYLLSRIGA